MRFTIEIDGDYVGIDTEKEGNKGDGCYSDISNTLVDDIKLLFDGRHGNYSDLVRHLVWAHGAGFQPIENDSRYPQEPDGSSWQEFTIRISPPDYTCEGCGSPADDCCCDGEDDA